MNKKIHSVMLLTLLMASMLTLAFSIQPVKTDTLTDEYYSVDGESLDIGFSKYGEMINPDVPVGLRYGLVDPFANPNIPMTEWNRGWLMNMTYNFRGERHNVWAYALFSDFSEVGGDWINNASSPWDSRPGFKGGRKTNGYATTEPMEVIYDGPRRCVVKLKTTIFDPRVPYPPEPVRGIPLVDLVMHVVFNKVKKYVLLIKDIKLRTESKLLGKVQVKFSQRGEWDLGWLPEDWMPHSYAHFYHALPTEHFEHPWYMAEGMETGYDLLQIIDKGENYAAFAAYWPELMSWRVEDIVDLYIEEKLSDLSDWECHWLGDGEIGIFVASVPGYYTGPLHYPDCWFPPHWSYAEPEVYVDGVKKTYGVHYEFDFTPGTPGGYNRDRPGECVEETPGTFELRFTTPPAEGADIHVRWKLHAEQDDMTCEPRTPYTMGEWAFDLSYYDTDLPTHQFRCITVYGVTDLNDGDDWDIGYGHENVIDSGVVFDLLANPIADFTYAPEKPFVNQEVTFNSTSFDVDGYIVSWEWDFNNDSVIDATTEDATWTYTEARNYTVTLNVTDNDGLWDTQSKNITVYAPPVANFTYSPSDPVVDETVTFNASASYDPDGTIVDYDWNFGDGTSDTGMVVTHTYSTGGVYPVALTVTDDKGLTDTTIAKVTVRHRILTIQLSGEHDYLRMENVKIRVAALVRDAETMEPVSGANVTIEVYNPEGSPWISDNMTERLLGTGIYEWNSAKTIRELMKRGSLSKGVYLVHAQASYRGGPIATDILEFHIDPPYEEPIQLQTSLLLLVAGALATVISIWYIDHRRLVRKLNQLGRTA